MMCPQESVELLDSSKVEMKEMCARLARLSVSGFAQQVQPDHCLELPQLFHKG